jgi:peptidyl-prolyl cis-trans isomerase SurA
MAGMFSMSNGKSLDAVEARRRIARDWAVVALFGLMTLAPGAAARAQTIVATVNGDPVTNTDIAERAKLLSALGQGGASALDSLIQSRLEAGEINKYGIRISGSELAPTMTYYAEKAHVTTEVLGARLQKSGVDKKHLENFLSIHQGFNMYARARNRAVEVSEAEVNAEIARDPKLKREQSFTLRQVLITVPASAGMAGLEAAGKQMHELSGRFTDCVSGPKLTSEFPNMVVRDPVTRGSSQLGEQFVALLNKTPIGHLTPPSRDSNGIVSLAVCERSAAKDDAVRDAARERILARMIDRDAEKLYQELRKTAVIVKSK